MPKPTRPITVATPSVVLRTLLAIAQALSTISTVLVTRFVVPSGKIAWSGTRLMGKAFDNFDFTLNYLYKRADPAALVEWGAAFDINQLGPEEQEQALFVQIFLFFPANDPAQRAPMV